MLGFGGIDQFYAAYFDRQYEMIRVLRPRVIGHLDIVRIHDPDYRSRLVKPVIWEKIVRNLELTPLKVGETVQLSNVFFVQGKNEFLPESEPELDRILELLNENSSLEIELGGHTDNQGSSSANFKLSESRALAVMTYLIENGIDKKRLKYKGYGGTKPIASNASAESRKKNRRVEIKILKF